MTAAFLKAGVDSPDAVKAKLETHVAALGPSDTIGLVVYRVRQGLIDPPEVEDVESAADSEGPPDYNVWVMEQITEGLIMPAEKPTRAEYYREKLWLRDEALQG